MLAHTTPRLCAAAANAGVVAFEGAGQLGKDVLVSRIRETQAMLNAGAVFGVNLFVPSGFYTDPSSWTEPQAAAVEVARERYEGYLSELSGEGLTVATEDAIRLNASAITLSVFVGAEGERETLLNLAKLCDEGQRYGIPVLAVTAVLV